MSISEKLSTQLQTILSGDAWYGSPVYEIVESISFEAAYEKVPGSVHNIAEIVLHMIAWTEEVMDRMNGLPSGIPTSGDWPETGAPDEQKWQNYVDDLKLVNVNLVGVIQNFPQEQWNEATIDERNRQLGTGVNYEELVNGLIEHHVYHSGQIALLNRIING
ncbi:DinB family protein [Mucilaginibacter sp. FT3.2]|uniref:DinB family protein n=1 Tax=Mucilaginibacter sp. FT3.2 TaxID=2723090 RepID=UPI00160F56C8|nr:DinB family protein [Mucilaginibacter sp. FT3.2]MBB6235369.1 putative damage-inducible protein DinB [Mucilaginibacter sp. FT3.2]